MHIIYFDENKYSTDNPYFFIGGVLIEENNLSAYETELIKIQYKYLNSQYLTKETELHGKEIFHGKGNFKKVQANTRMNLLEDIADFIISFKIPIRIVCLDVNAHKQRYTYPIDEYNWSLTLFLERVCDYLDRVRDIAIVFGDYEKDKMQKSINSFCSFKMYNTPYYFGRDINALKDTIYYISSQNSRFMQLADIVIYMASRYKMIQNRYNNNTTIKYLDDKLKKIWEKILNGTDCYLQEWPNK